MSPAGLFYGAAAYFVLRERLSGLKVHPSRRGCVAAGCRLERALLSASTTVCGHAHCRCARSGRTMTTGCASSRAPCR
jgi:hypothetical protein